MEYLSSNTFTRASISEDSQQFFVRLWCELLNSDTIDTYRVRVMNAHSILKELEEVINDKITEEISVNNIYFVTREAKRLLNTDKICQLYFKSETDFTLKYLEHLSNNFKEQDLYQILSKIKILSSKLDDKYFDLLFDELYKAIFVSKVIEDIFSLTNSLATELLWRGFSLQYLYRRKSYFLDSTRVYPFEDKFKTFRTDVTNTDRNFTIYIKFSATSSILQIPQVFLFNISDSFTPHFNSQDETNFSSQPGSIYGKLDSISSADPFSAVYATIKKLSLLQNLSRYEYRKNDFKLSPLILVYDFSNDKNYLIEANPPSLGFVSAGQDYRFKQYINHFNILLDKSKSKLDNLSVSRLMNSFHYFRMSLDSADPETRFLLNWIALEYLIKVDTPKKLIEKAVTFIPKMLATQYLNKLLKDLAANTVRLRCDQTILTGIGFNYYQGKIDLKSIFETIKLSTKLSTVISAVSDHLLIERYQLFSSIINDHKKLENIINHHKEDVEWNLQRIYRARNKIVHSASTHLDLMQLDGNLTYYYTTVFNNVLFSAVRSKSNLSLDDIFFEYEAKYELIMHKIKSGITTVEIL